MAQTRATKDRLRAERAEWVLLGIDDAQAGRPRWDGRINAHRPEVRRRKAHYDAGYDCVQGPQRP
jgi:hypothetical protein